MSDFLKFINSKKPLGTMINKYTNRFTKIVEFNILGSIPYSLTEPIPKSITLDARRSMVFTTEAEAITAILATGMTHFQLSDYSFYGDTESKKENCNV